jgi:hypothetical protein
MEPEHELFPLEELEMTNMEIENPYDKLFEKFNSLINQLKDGTPKSKEKIAELIGKANTILTRLDAVTRQLIEDGLITQTDVKTIVMKILELRNILDNLTNMNKGGKKRKSKKSKKRNSKKRRRKSMKR